MTYAIPVEVRFADLDALGHVNSTRILAYAEQARVRWMLEAGYAPSPTNLPIILAMARAEYHAPIPHDATVEVVMGMPRVGTKSWDWLYSVRDLDGTLYATVRTVQVAYDYAAAASRPITTAERALLETLRIPDPDASGGPTNGASRARGSAVPHLDPAREAP